MVRVGDSQREAAAELLQAHLVAGRITQAEFDERVEQALEAQTAEDIAELFTDLPANPDAVGGISIWKARQPANRPTATHPLRIAQRWMIIMAPVLWVLALTSWSLWWLGYVIWGIAFIIVTRIAKQVDPSS